MIHTLEDYTIEEFETMVDEFDVDEEIDLHREADLYKKHFTITQSVADFTDYHNRLKKVLQQLKDHGKKG